MASDREARWPHKHRPSGMDWIHRSTRMAIYERDGHVCINCGGSESLSLDHIDDVRGHVPENLVTACNTCNGTRADQSIEEAYGEDVARRAREQAAKSLDRAKGRALAKAKWPERFEKHRQANARRRARGDTWHGTTLATT